MQPNDLDTGRDPQTHTHTYMQLSKLIIQTNKAIKHYASPPMDTYTETIHYINYVYPVYYVYIMYTMICILCVYRMTHYTLHNLHTHTHTTHTVHTLCALKAYSLEDS